MNRKFRDVFPELHQYNNDELLDALQRELELKALKGGNPIFRDQIRGHCTDLKKIDNTLQKQTLNLLSHGSTGSNGCTKIWRCGEGLISFYYSLSQDKSYYATVEIVHPNKTLIKELMTELKFIISKRPSSSSIMVLSSMEGGLDLTSIGKVNNPLIEMNYSTSTIEAYKHVAACLKTNTPCGRFILLSGPPGTGKSYLIRALSSEVGALFVLVPSNIGNALTGPTILPVLTSYKESKAPIVLILEDGDSYISKEARTINPGGLSDILNLGDGLVGQLADIRIIVTSNANKINLDDAVIRPGRMCQHIPVNYLTLEEAINAYIAITGSEPPKDIWTTSSTKITLAEVYRRARDKGWAPNMTHEKEQLGGTYV